MMIMAKDGQRIVSAVVGMLRRFIVVGTSYYNWAYFAEIAPLLRQKKILGVENSKRLL